jgi:hypothetical protein
LTFLSYFSGWLGQASAANIRMYFYCNGKLIFIIDLWSVIIIIVYNINLLMRSILITIQLMTFDKVDIMIYQPRRSDNDQGQWPRWLSLLGLINNKILCQQISKVNNCFIKWLDLLKGLWLVHKNTLSNQNVWFKANVIYIWVLDRYSWYTNCPPLVQDCTVIIMFDQKGRCMVLTNQESRFFSVI